MLRRECFGIPCRLFREVIVAVTSLILQLSDLHLFADPHARLRGVPPYDCLADVLGHVQATELDLELLVLTGDLAHDERRETYALLQNLLEPWADRVLVIPGNHDQREFMREAFPGQFAGETCPGPYVTFARRTGPWLLAGLDSHLPGEVAGRIDAAQLDWLDGLLRRHAGPCLLFLHHPPVSIESPWLDELALQEPEGLKALLRSHPQIAAVAAGHVHQEYNGQVEGRPFLTAPSTAMQFVPGQAEPLYDAIPCGYRLFALEGAGWTSRVVRLPGLRFPPEQSG